jgi:hypothetical protein
MAITSLKRKNKSGEMLAGNTYFDPARFFSIASYTGTGNPTSITFSDIPQTYQHLQLRILGRTVSTGLYGASVRLQMNNDTSTNYARHLLYGDRSTASAGQATSQAFMAFSYFVSETSASTSNYSASILDILDYKTTSKYKTVKGIGGWDSNSAGTISIGSGLWLSSSAITSLKITFDSSSSMATDTSITLYGIKG